ncbi:MAG: type IX secretion system protein PorQ [Bacteroidia bacterium]|nr:type IX secretion system protein PorQ [Bacteroidia bacterium]
MKLIGIIIGLLISIDTYAQVGGTRSYTFLDVTPSARTAALGRTNITGNNDISSVVINPATLSNTHNKQLSLTYFNYFAGINYGMANYAQNTRLGIFSYALQYVNYGKFQLTDETGVINGEFKASDYCLSVSYSKPLTKDSSFRLGASFKTLYSNYYTYNSVAIAADVALLYIKPEKKFSASVLFKNAGIPLKQYNAAQKSILPIEAQLGVSQGLEHVPLIFYATLNNFQKPNLTFIDSAKLVTKDPLTGLPVKDKKNYADYFFRHFTAGAELSPVKSFSIRIAYDYKQRAEMKINERPGIVGFSFGFGVRTKRFSIDYGRLQFHRAGATNLFTFTLPISTFFKSSI